MTISQKKIIKTINTMAIIGVITVIMVIFLLVEINRVRNNQVEFEDDVEMTFDSHYTYLKNAKCDINGDLEELYRHLNLARPSQSKESKNKMNRC